MVRFAYLVALLPAVALAGPLAARSVSPTSGAASSGASPQRSPLSSDCAATPFPHARRAAATTVVSMCTYNTLTAPCTDQLSQVGGMTRRAAVSSTQSAAPSILASALSGIFPENLSSALSGIVPDTPVSAHPPPPHPPPPPPPPTSTPTSRRPTTSSELPSSTDPSTA